MHYKAEFPKSHVPEDFFRNRWNRLQPPVPLPSLQQIGLKSREASSVCWFSLYIGERKRKALLFPVFFSYLYNSYFFIRCCLLPDSPSCYSLFVHTSRIQKLTKSCTFFFKQHNRKNQHHSRKYSQPPFAHDQIAHTF